MTTSRTEASDGDLVIAAAAGDRGAFATLYERHHAGVYRFARTMTGTTMTAEDVTQEVFLALMQGLDKFDPARGSLSTYLYGVARNISRHRLRMDRRLIPRDDRHSCEPLDPDDDPSQVVIRTEAAARLRRHILSLSSRYREVLILCDLHELSYEAAASILGTPVGTVRSRLHRARQMLTDRLVAASVHRAGQKRSAGCAT